MKKAHIIGICGVAMSGTAKLLLDEGYEVSGSDTDFYPPASTYVQKLGISVHRGYSAKNIPADVDLIVVGRNAKLSPDENEEVAYAQTLNVPVRSFPEVIAEISAGFERIVVAGSYGKSTVTSLIAFVLEHAGKKPGYFIGAYPLNLEHSAQKGDGALFVIEGDEYPTAHWDTRSKFLHFDPKNILITSVDHDHVNVFPTYEEYRKPFEELVEAMPNDGTLVVCADNEGAMRLTSLARHAVTYGLTEKAEWRAQNKVYGEITTFDLTHNGNVVASLSTTLLGAHNLQNIVGAAALLLGKKYVTPEEFVAAVRDFKGVQRRLNRITDETALPAYEGFGSSYEKARAAIQAIRLHFKNKRMIVLFEPHTFSWRNRDALSWYKDVFTEVDQVLIYKPAQQGAQTHEQLSHEEIVAAVTDAGIVVKAVSNENETHEALTESLSIGRDSVLLVLTSGNLDGILDSLPEWLNSQYANI